MSNNQPDMDLLNAIFGIESQSDWDDDFSNTNKARSEQVDESAEQRADEFWQEIASADTTITNRPDPFYRLNTGQFGSGAAKRFGYDAMFIRQADRSDVDDARRAGEGYRALQQIRGEQPELYAILMARKANMSDRRGRGPLFGQEHGE